MRVRARDGWRVLLPAPDGGNLVLDFLFNPTASDVADALDGHSKTKFTPVEKVRLVTVLERLGDDLAKPVPIYELAE